MHGSPFRFLAARPLIHIHSALLLRALVPPLRRGPPVRPLQVSLINVARPREASFGTVTGALVL